MLLSAKALVFLVESDITRAWGALSIEMEGLRCRVAEGEEQVPLPRQARDRMMEVSGFRCARGKSGSFSLTSFGIRMTNGEVSGVRYYKN